MAYKEKKLNSKEEAEALYNLWNSGMEKKSTAAKTQKKKTASKSTGNKKK